MRLKTVEGVQEVSSFLRILSSLCDKHFMNEELVEPGEDEGNSIKDREEALFLNTMCTLSKFCLMVRLARDSNYCLYDFKLAVISMQSLVYAVYACHSMGVFVTCDISTQGI